MRRISSIVLAAALSLGALFGLAAAASAENLPYNGVATISGPTTARAGVAIQIVLKGFAPNETVRLVIYSDPQPLGPGTVVADGTGTVTTSVTLPSNLTPGNHTIVGTGVSSGRTASYTIVIQGDTTQTTAATTATTAATTATTAATTATTTAATVATPTDEGTADTPSPESSDTATTTATSTTTVYGLPAANTGEKVAPALPVIG
ncbi:MAG: hypothetical protein LBR32_03280 [Propionibacteriaceae bacterium]|jgi:hypothetical protein|nr:hypothetical protein [Propionibacteriaceae bacterium]